MSPKFSQPNDAERAWLASNVSATRTMIAKLLGECFDIEPSALDVAFEIWRTQHDAKNEDSNPVINAFGIAFGQYLVDHLDLNWVVASDEHGTEMAVHGQPGDILVYPLNLVAKRYIAREAGFFVPLFDGFRSQFELIRTQRPSRQRWKFW